MNKCKYNNAVRCRQDENKRCKEACFVCLATHMCDLLDHLTEHVIEQKIKMKDAACIFSNLVDLSLLKMAFEAWFEQHVPEYNTRKIRLIKLDLAKNLNVQGEYIR